MTKPTANQPSSAVDELRAAAFVLTDATGQITKGSKIAESLVPLVHAERIITAQEQRLGELEAKLATLTVQYAELTAIVVGIETERDEYRAALARLQSAG